MVLGLVLPLMTITNSLIDGGFTITRFPPILCSPKSADAIFFTFILPIDLIIGVGTTLLIVIVWKLHMVIIYIRYNMFLILILHI